jgi:hypothetical protein
MLEGSSASSPGRYKLRHWPPGTDGNIRAVFFVGAGLLPSVGKTTWSRSGFAIFLSSHS